MGVSSEYTTKELLPPIKPHVRGCSMVYTDTGYDHLRNNVADLEFRHLIFSET